MPRGVQVFFQIRVALISVIWTCLLAPFAFPGADQHVDVLYCEIHCESLQQVQLVWLALSKRFQNEEEPWKIVALWDGFAQEEERRCSKIVLSMDGQLAYLGMSFNSFKHGI